MLSQRCRSDRSTRCLIPSSILRSITSEPGSITSEPGSITSMPKRWPAAAPLIAIRLRLISRVEPSPGARARSRPSHPPRSGSRAPVRDRGSPPASQVGPAGCAGHPRP